MKLTKSQENVIIQLERENSNPLKSRDTDHFTMFEVKGLELDEDFNTVDVAVDGKGKTGDIMIHVASVPPTALDMEEFDYRRDMCTYRWSLSISKRGKVEAYRYPEIHKSGETTWSGIHIL